MSRQISAMPILVIGAAVHASKDIDWEDETCNNK